MRLADDHGCGFGMDLQGVVNLPVLFWKQKVEN
jgi:hypothetical protein